ncbi:P-II family nitrogen regulator [Ectothiorhodospiraceae bacterium BW-2]|nr:P-II family nitrogen regulator [Ectothiorhodospiraceae bacterium BW-2]
MSKKEIVILTDVALITAAVPKGHADAVVQAAQEGGAQGASIHYAFGRGVRERLGILGLTIDAEKEVINIVVSSDQVDHIVDRIYSAGRFDTPGMGFLWVTPVEKAATFIPADILNKIAAQERGEEG